MRRTLFVVACVGVVVGMLASPASAQAPSPKVTITGLFDQVTSAGANFYDGNYSRNNDREWYARTRFRPDIVFQVGRTKANLALEMDLQYGQSSASASGAGKGAAAPSGKPGETSDSSLNTDVAGVIEIKWAYTEFDLTGKDSLMPFIPVLTVARAGLQPFDTLATYTTGQYASGDFPGVALVTTLAPNVTSKVAFVQVEEEIAGQNRGALAKATRGDDWALIVSPEYTPFRGLDIKPLYSFFFASGVTNGNARKSVADRSLVGGTTVAAATYAGGATQRYLAGDPSLHEERHTFGVSARWRSGSWGLDPTVLYQTGTRDVQAFVDHPGAAFTVERQETDMNAWLVDVTGSFRAGPLLLEVRPIYTTGNKARDNLSKRISYFEVLDADTTFYAGWAQILSLSIDYLNGLGIHNQQMTDHIGYDRYGRAQLGVRATYALTPALSVYTIVSPTWTAEKVDTHSGVTGNNRVPIDDKSFVRGDSRYIGTEADLGLTWKFAPNTAFDLVGAWLFAGRALDTFEILDGVATRRDAQDAWTIASRVRLSF